MGTLASAADSDSSLTTAWAAAAALAALALPGVGCLVMLREGAPSDSFISYASSRRQYCFLIWTGTCELLWRAGFHASATSLHCLRVTTHLSNHGITFPLLGTLPEHIYQQHDQQKQTRKCDVMLYRM